MTEKNVLGRQTYRHATKAQIMPLPVSCHHHPEHLVQHIGCTPHYFLFPQVIALDVWKISCLFALYRPGKLKSVLLCDSMLGLTMHVETTEMREGCASLWMDSRGTDGNDLGYLL